MREELQAILYSPHHVSKTRPAMSKIGRAAKFSAFKALEGHEDMIIEEGRLTDLCRELTEDETSELNEILYDLSNRPHESIPVKLTYFKPDSRKSGGEYLEYEGIYRYHNLENNSFVFGDGKQIPIDSIIKIAYK